jgi:hypothetical protein
MVAVLRLDALQPRVFTSQQLAEYANVQPETARAFTSPSKGPGYVETVPAAQLGAVYPPNLTGGRPPHLYRLRAEGRAELLSRLGALRRELDDAAERPARAREDVLAPIDLLEKTLEAADAERNDEERDARLTEAQIELVGAKADVHALRHGGSPFAAEFERRLKAAAAWFTALKQCDVQDTAAMVSARADSFVEDLVQYEQNLKGLHTVIIVSDNPSRPEGKMRAMMRDQIRTGTRYLFFVPRLNGETSGPLPQTLEAYRAFRTEVIGSPQDPAAGKIELWETIPISLPHLIFYKFWDRPNMEMLLRKGDDLNAPHLLVTDPDVVDVIYRLIWRAANEISEQPPEIVVPAPGEFGHGDVLKSAQPPPLRVIQGGKRGG